MVQIFGIASIVAFAIAIILQLASVSKGALLTVTTFTLIGLLCLAVHLSTGWGHRVDNLPQLVALRIGHRAGT